MQFFTTCGADKVKRVFVSGTWDDGTFIVESVIPGGIREPAFELVSYLSDEQIEEISLAAHGAQKEVYRQHQEDRAADLYEERECYA